MLPYELEICAISHFYLVVFKRHVNKVIAFLRIAINNACCLSLINAPIYFSAADDFQAFRYHEPLPTVNKR